MYEASVEEAKRICAECEEMEKELAALQLQDTPPLPKEPPKDATKRLLDHIFGDLAALPQELREGIDAARQPFEEALANAILSPEKAAQALDAIMELEAPKRERE